MRSAFTLSLLGSLIGLFLLSGCELIVKFDRSKIGRDGSVGGDAGRDAGLIDATVAEAGIDAGRIDSGPLPDSGPGVDSGPFDSGPVDSGPIDSGPGDSGPAPVDSGSADSGPPDSGPIDSGPPPECFVPGDCNDSKPCTVDNCVSNHCTHTPMASNTECDLDSLFCTDDRCDSAGNCVAMGARACADVNVCTIDLCNEGADACSHVSVTDSILAVGFATMSGNDQVRLINPSSSLAIDFGDYFICKASGPDTMPVCIDIPAATNAAANGTVVVNGLGSLLVVGGEIALTHMNNGGEICDYMQWGVDTSHPTVMEAAAIAASRWQPPLPPADGFVNSTTLDVGEQIDWNPGVSSNNNAPAAWNISASSF